ncbi:MAG: hypothetical protein KDB21_19220, partial [Acidimicrobiales bacterium]|nr:hypothetical protein [Acidimicrobiales bacterium]
MRRFRRRAGLLALVVLAMVTAGCSADVELALPSTPPETVGPTATASQAAPQVEPTPTSESGSEAVGPGPTPTLDPLDWNGCGDGVECASLAVPLDHADPLGPRIEIALAR